MNISFKTFFQLTQEDKNKIIKDYFFECLACGAEMEIGQSVCPRCGCAVKIPKEKLEPNINQAKMEAGVYLKNKLKNFSFGLKLVYGCSHEGMEGEQVVTIASGNQLTLNVPVMIEQTIGELDMSENTIATLVIKNGFQVMNTDLKIKENDTMGNAEKIGIELVKNLNVRLIFQSGDKKIYSEEYALDL